MRCIPPPAAAARAVKIKSLDKSGTKIFAVNKGFDLRVEWAD